MFSETQIPDTCTGAMCKQYAWKLPFSVCSRLGAKVDNCDWFTLYDVVTSLTLTKPGDKPLVLAVLAS